MDDSDQPQEYDHIDEEPPARTQPATKPVYTPAPMFSMPMKIAIGVVLAIAALLIALYYFKGTMNPMVLLGKN